VDNISKIRKQEAINNDTKNNYRSKINGSKLTDFPNTVLQYSDFAKLEIESNMNTFNFINRNTDMNEKRKQDTNYQSIESEINSSELKESSENFNLDLLKIKFKDSNYMNPSNFERMDINYHSDTKENKDNYCNVEMVEINKQDVFDQFSQFVSLLRNRFVVNQKYKTRLFSNNNDYAKYLSEKEYLESLKNNIIKNSNGERLTEKELNNLVDEKKELFALIQEQNFKNELIKKNSIKIKKINTIK
jgi:hypothetical protein